MVTNTTNFLAIALVDGSLVCWERCIDSGVVPIGTVITDSTHALLVTPDNSFEMPQTRIPNFKAASANTSRVMSVTLLGSSLGQQNWIEWLTNTNNAALGENWLPATHNFYYNSSGGGQTAYYALAMMGRSTAPNPLAANQDFSGTAVAQPGYIAQFLAQLGYPGANYVARSPIVSTAPDMFITEGLMYNRQESSASRDVYLGMEESKYRNVVRARQRGANIEGIIYTVGSGNVANLNDKWAEGFIAKQFADLYGFALADWAARSRYAVQMGQTVTVDGIHPNSLGNTNECLAIRGVCNAYTQVSAPQVTVLAQRAFNYASTGNSTNFLSVFPEDCDVIFTPDFTTGTVTNTAISAFTNSMPSMLFGGKASASAVTRVQAGQIWQFDHDKIGLVGIFIDPPASNATYRFTYQNGGGRSVVGVTNSIVPHLGINANFISGPTLSEIAAISPGVFGNGGYWYNSGLALEVLTGGPLDVIGAAVFTPAYDPIPWSNVELWSVTNTVEKAWVRKTTGGFGSHGAVTTDAIGDWVVIPFTGAGVSFQLQENVAGGQVSVFLDGVPMDTVELYNGGSGSYLYQKNFMCRTSGTGVTGFSSGDHVLALQLTGFNAGASAPTTSTSRLKLVKADVIH